jgi:hypothetical protein
MDTTYLRDLLNRAAGLNRDPAEVVINIAKPSIGPTATCKVTSAYYGFDWENGLFILSPAQPLVPKTEKEELWDAASGFIFSLSEEKTYRGNPTSLALEAKRILETIKNCSTKK